MLKEGAMASCCVYQTEPGGKASYRRAPIWRASVSLLWTDNSKMRRERRSQALQVRDKSHIFLILKSRKHFQHMHRKAPWRSKGNKWCQPTHRLLPWNPSCLRDEHVWEDPEINQIQTQNQAEQGDWPKETWKKCPVKVTESTVSAHSLWAHLCVYSHALYSFLPNKCFTCFIALCLYVEIHFYPADGPRPCHWPLPLVV